MRVLIALFYVLSFLYASDDYKVLYVSSNDKNTEFALQYIKKIEKISNISISFQKFYSITELQTYIANNSFDMIISTQYIKSSNNKFLYQNLLGLSGYVIVNSDNLNLFNILSSNAKNIVNTNEYNNLYDNIYTNYYLDNSSERIYFGLFIILILIIIIFIYDKFNTLIIKSFRNTNKKGNTNHIDEAFCLTQNIAHIGVFDWDIKDNTMWWSEEMYRLYDLNDITHTPNIESFYINMSDEDIQKLSKKLKYALAGVEEYIISYKIQYNNTTKHIIAQAQIFRDENHKAIRMIGTNQDITSYIELEDKLQEVSKYLQNQAQLQAKKRLQIEQRYRVLFDSSVNTILIIENNHIIDCNDMAVKLFECDNKKELIGKGLFDLSPQYQVNNELSIIKKSYILQQLSENKKIEYDWIYQTKNNKQIHFDIHLFTTKFDGKETQYAICKDISK